MDYQGESMPGRDPPARRPSAEGCLALVRDSRGALSWSGVGRCDRGAVRERKGPSKDQHLHRVRERATRGFLITLKI